MISQRDIKKSHQKVLQRIFTNPAPKSIKWEQVVALVKALGGISKEGRGSRVRFYLNGVVASLHKPHPNPEVKPYAVRDLRDFLKEAGYE